MVIIKIITTFILNIILSVALNILILCMHIITYTIDISKSEDTYNIRNSQIIDFDIIFKIHILTFYLYILLFDYNV